MNIFFEIDIYNLKFENDRDWHFKLLLLKDKKV